MSLVVSQDSQSESSIDKSTYHRKPEMGADAHTEHAGASSEPSVTHEEHRNELWWSKVREYGQEFFSEFFGTMVLILFGDGVVAQVVLSNGTKGDYQSISWGWG